MKTLDWIALTLVIIGAINLGLIGFFHFDAIGSMFGAGLRSAGYVNGLSRFFYGLVGLAGLYSLSLYARLDYGTDSETFRNTRSRAE